MARRNHSAAGFTLIELLVAIGILAMVAVLGWRGLDSIMRSREVLTGQLEQARGMQLAFAQMQGMAEGEALACFGRYYREDVLKHPQNQDHANIREFMRKGWAGLNWHGTPLVARTS